MPHHKDAIKRMRQNAEKRTRNRHYRSTMRTRIKKVRQAIDAGDHAAASGALPEAVSVIQALAQKKVIHPRQANRRVARLTKAVNGLRTASE